MVAGRINLITAVIGVIVVLLTLLLFLMLPWAVTGLDIAGLLFCFLGEIGLFGGIVVLNRPRAGGSGLILRSGGYTILGIYAAAAIALSVIFVLWLRDGLRLLILLQCILFAAAVILLLLIGAAGCHVSEKDAALEATRSPLRELLLRVERLRIGAEDASYAPALGRLAEDIRFFDTTDTLPDDGLIEQELSALEALITQNGDSGGIAASIDRLSRLAGHRAEQSKHRKEGEI